MSVNRVKNDGTLELLAGRPNMNTIAAKADQVTSATKGNFAGLDINGNLIDSGHKPSDYSEKPLNSTNGNMASLDGNGNLVDSGLAFSVNNEGILCITYDDET